MTTQWTQGTLNAKRLAHIRKRFAATFAAAALATLFLFAVAPPSPAQLREPLSEFKQELGQLDFSVSPMPARSGAPVTFTVDGDPFGSYRWTFGDGSAPSNGPAIVSHVYARPGPYNVTVEIPDPRLLLRWRRTERVLVLDPLSKGFPIGFDELPDGTLVAGQYAASHGVVFRNCAQLPAFSMLRAAVRGGGAVTPGNVVEQSCGADTLPNVLDAEFTSDRQSASLWIRGGFGVELEGFAADGTELDSDRPPIYDGVSWYRLEVAAPGAAALRRVRLSLGHTAYAELDDFSAVGDAPPPAPVANVTPGRLDFGRVRSGGQSPPRTITVQNVGTAELRLDPVQLSGLRPGEFRLVAGQDACSGVSLNPGDQCTLQVLYAPTTQRLGFADVLIQHNAADSPSIVDLSGEPERPS